MTTACWFALSSSSTMTTPSLVLPDPDSPKIEARVVTYCSGSFTSAEKFRVVGIRPRSSHSRYARRVQQDGRGFPCFVAAKCLWYSTCLFQSRTEFFLRSHAEFGKIPGQ